MKPTPPSPYTIRISPRAKHLRLTVYRDGRCIMTLPARGSRTEAELFWREKKRWVMAKREYFSQQQQLIDPKTHPIQKYRAKALALILRRLEYYNQHYHLAYESIAVRDQKTKWGTCTRHRTLNFNYRILWLPPDIADYLIVHELCHLQEFHHGPSFWALVGETIPDFERRRQGLLRFG